MPTESEKPGSEGRLGIPETVIRLENASVEYRAPRERIRTLKEYVIRMLQRRVKHDMFLALREVSLEIKKGEVFGIIGHNGAGKSTLLKVVSRVMKPTGGRVWVKGRVAPLLELGAGFHPELSGRENIFLNGTLLGYKHAELEALFEGIVDFAELRDFIDAPIRTYSTGMTVRLGFAVATAVQPDILIVDEVLAVGDEQFKEKCSIRMDQFRENGTTILLVTHDSKVISTFCDRAAWLDHGRLRAIGDSLTVIDQYLTALRPVREVAVAEPATPAEGAESPDEAELPRDPIARAVWQKRWAAPFQLPDGRLVPQGPGPTNSQSMVKRLKAIISFLNQMLGRSWSDSTCLEIGCRQGYYSFQLARQGFRTVVGIDANQQTIEDADLIRQLHALPNLQYRQMDWTQAWTLPDRPFDVVLMLGFPPMTENPIGALRRARLLTRQMLIVETMVKDDSSAAAGEVENEHRLGSFQLVERPGVNGQSPQNPGSFSLYPDLPTLLKLIRRNGFSHARVIASGEPSPEAPGFRSVLIAGVVESTIRGATRR